jgi:ATP-binding cassette subfamily F protein uup
MKKLEREIAQSEQRKKAIEERFLAADITPAEIEKLSSELGVLQSLLDEKEMRWLELSEKA